MRFEDMDKLRKKSVLYIQVTDFKLLVRIIMGEGTHFLTVWIK